jgi:hypothetical protein
VHKSTKTNEPKKTKTKEQKAKKTNNLNDRTQLPAFSPLGGCNLVFFAHLFGSLVSLENPVKTVEKCRYHWGKLRGLACIRQFCL